MRGKPILVFVTLLAIVPALAACDTFDTDKLDVFNLNQKKKLPGERKALFPEGIPGVAQGIPPDLVKGYKPPEVAETPPEVQEKPKEASRPRVVRRAPKPAAVTVQPASQPAAAPAQQQQPAWPDPKPQQTGAQSPWPAPQKQTSPWPDAPPPNTFQR